MLCNSESFTFPSTEGEIVESINRRYIFVMTSFEIVKSFCNWHIFSAVASEYGFFNSARSLSKLLLIILKRLPPVITTSYDFSDNISTLSRFIICLPYVRSWTSINLFIVVVIRGIYITRKANIQAIVHFTITRHDRRITALRINRNIVNPC